MAPVLRQGWEVNDPTVSSTQFKAKVSVTAVSGSSAGRSTQIAIVNNTSTGAFDLYTPTAFGFGDPFASYSPSQDKLIPTNKETFDLFFDQNTPTGKSQLTNITKSTKLATYDLAQIQTGTDPTSNQNFENIKKLKGYQSLANSTPAGERAAGAVPTDPENPNGGNQQAPFNQEDANKGGELANNISIGNREGTRGIKEYPNNSLLRYPITMDPKQDCIKFTMLEYAPKKLTVSSSTLDIQENRSTTEEKRRGSTVVLPVQPSISDSNTVKWGSADMSTLQGMAASVAMKAITDTNNFAATASELGSIASGLNNSNKSVKTGLAAYYAGEAAKVKGLLTRVTGGIVNPNMELLFDGPDLRIFTFSFSLSAREPNEAKNIRNIIRFFKQGMSVKRADTGLFLKSPNTFEIKYMFGETEEHPWINKIKECALTSCNVIYTPAGNYATYEDGSMTQYDITLSFSELEPIYDDDYGSGGGTGNESMIGY